MNSDEPKSRLSDHVAAFDAVQEGVNIAGIALVGMAPIIGGPVQSVVTGILAAQAQKRNAELLGAITSVVDSLVDQVEGLTVEAIVSDPRFLATAEKVARAAQETVDDRHRIRLIHALRHAGPWSAQEPYATERMTDLLIRLGPIHIFVTRFFADPAAWLQANAGERWSDGTETFNGGTLRSIFGKYVFPNAEVPPGELARIVYDVQRESIMIETAGELLGIQLSATGVIEPRLTEFGRSFLAFAEGELEP